MSRLDTLVEATPFPSWRRAAWLVVLLLAAAVAWAYHARLDEVAIASAEVVPQGQVKIIQHLEGGILREIRVIEGQRVETGSPLALLDLGAGGINRDELLVQIDGLLLRRARLAAEAQGHEPDFPAELARRRPELARSEREAFDSRRRQLQSALEVYATQKSQREHEVRELEARQKAVGDSLVLARQRFRMSEDLVERSLVSRMEHLKLQSELTALEGQLAQLEPAIPKLRAAIAEVAERRREAVFTFRRTATEALGEVELALARNREILARASDQVQRTLVRSPIDGIVKNLRFHTIGGVVGPGDPIMEIVPSGESLVIEGRLSPTDIGYVAVGQKARVKLTTYDYVRYGALDGLVETVAADTSTDADGRHFYKVLIRTDKGYLGASPGALPIIPGMQATVDIHTGEKSVIDYLITPVLKLRHEAFRER